MSDAADREGKGEGEAQAVVRRYARRGLELGDRDRYSMLRPDVWLAAQERQRAMLRLFVRLGWTDLSQRRLLEVGCGEGANLQELLRLGFAARHLSGVELLDARWAQAREGLPAALALHLGDAARLELPEGSQDVVFVSTVFSSLLDDGFQQRLAQAMWRWVRPGGGVLWYDFTVDNPHNPDVRGVTLRRLRALFPLGEVRAERVSLAPPLARVVARVHPGLYTLLNLLPVLRTHLLAWVAKRP